MMAGVYSVSELVYHCVNDIIGCREAVIMKRDFFDIQDILHNRMDREFPVKMTSGSRREGFDMESSDYDFMYWSPKEHVICHFSQVNLYNIYVDRVILMEDKYTKPGFVLLRLFSNVVNYYTFRSLVMLNNHYYIGSSMYRKCIHSNITDISNSTIHGPCTSGFIGNVECDFGYCFASKHWPPQAYYWIERSKRQRWPSPSVLRNITQSGCHFMAIGSKSSPTELIEWRLSFSQAEQKLVCSMNHCQFLVYGLLKLFLKEVLNKGISEDNKLMCSYFMKTVVFWEIQNNVSIQWNTETFLFCLWRCYKCLVKWVYSGYCPNFFVPQNNMFYPKITGSRQQRLLCQLLDLYSEGLPCLLRCSSINNKLLSVLINPQQPIILTNLYFLMYYHDRLLHSLQTEIRPFGINSSWIYQKYEEFRTFCNTKLNSNISQAQRVFVYRCIIQIHRYWAFLLQTNHTHTTNTETYLQRQQGLRLMKMTTKNGWLTDVLYLAMYHFIDGRYRKTLCLLQETQVTMYKPYVMYMDVNKYYYITLCGKSMREKIKASMACHIVLPAFLKFPELILELRLSYLGLVVSPFVLLHFLLFLCHYHLKCVQQHQSLHALRLLVQWDEDRYVCNIFKDIAWQMLGICHQLSNYPSQAIECYWEAQRYSSHNRIQQAVIYRIQDVERQILIQNSSSQY